MIVKCIESVKMGWEICFIEGNTYEAEWKIDEDDDRIVLQTIDEGNEEHYISEETAHGCNDSWFTNHFIVCED